MITHIILDLDGTLYENKSVVLDVLKQFSKENNLDLNEVKLNFIKAENTVKEKQDQFNDIKHFFNEVHKVFLPLVGFDNNEENLAYLESLVKKSENKVLLDITPRKGVIDFLEYLKSKKLKIIIFSGGHEINTIIDNNVRTNHFERELNFKMKQIKKLEIDHLIDEMIPSSKFCGYKPQKEVFERLINYLGCKGSDCIMIGDSIVDVAANQVRMKTILIDNKDKDGKWVPDHRVKDFFEIKKVVKSYIENSI
ncbi:HAD family hydrolase [Candidatus Woesearchaeota archaeon]|nr:HAD family hydrolase [Candidatus Woesearchaeota archaeon]